MSNSVYARRLMTVTCSENISLMIEANDKRRLRLSQSINHRLRPWPLITPIPAEPFERNGISNSAQRPNAPALSVLSSQDIPSRVSNKLSGGGVGTFEAPTHLIKDFSITLRFPTKLFKRNGISNSALRPNTPALSVLSSQDIRSCVSIKLGVGGGFEAPTHLIKDFLHHTAFSGSPAQF
ncbi:hypothetical protein CEXT_19961 [Caerostris extrusa]|uniref:Uncharacterized protein n=1 Tax=Caerostris extrusa TaxID=172846 RepID=A0AAV4VLU4_CAEEX|nr:hypothetical protein CEXT_19961 [Caerostris extrusa]